jgi:hypothetical protein
MNREDIIRMARDSGMELYGFGKDREKFVHYLQEFATLVAAAEREACAKVCDGWDFVPGGHEFTPQQLVKNVTETISHNIRARGQA